jgi:hypothetical protein
MKKLVLEPETLSQYLARTQGIPTCQWENDGEGNWETGCGDAFVILDGTPAENKMMFCCYCGKRIKESSL